MLAKNQFIFLDKLGAIFIALLGLSSFWALIKFNYTYINSLFYYDSKLVVKNHFLQLIGSKLAATWLYWLGGAAYVLTFGLAIYGLGKLFKLNWGFKIDRFLGLIGSVIALNILCQLNHIGSYGNLPGGGVFGSWLVLKFKLEPLLWQVLANGLLWASLVAYTRLCFITQVQYLMRVVKFICWPISYLILTKLNSYTWLNKFMNYKNSAQVVLDEQLQQSVLEHDYAQVLAELNLSIGQDQFWQNYISPKKLEDSDANLNLSLDSSEPDLVELESAQTLDFKKINHDINLPTITPELKSTKHEQKNTRQILDQQAQVLINKLKRFGIMGSVSAIKPGPVITLFEFTPAEDAKISKIVALENDLALALQTASLRIIAPVPGKPVVGFEVANVLRESVMLTDVLQDSRFTDFVQNIKHNNLAPLAFKIPIAIGKDTIGENVIIDLVKTPHLLVAGSTGSGKSVALNTILVSMLCANPPSRLRLILIDPKRLEFARYADIGHLLFPIISDSKRVLLTLRWVVKEMERRYEQMAKAGVRNMADYNQYIKNSNGLILPYIVIVIDELADLMMTSGKDVEDLITRIAQMARAAGIHMIVATQRPSVDVVTGLIKVNFPSRISFRVASKADSRTILDSNGADTLLGAGDMLMLDAQSAALKRAHGAYVTDVQISEIVEFILANYQTNYLNLDEMQFAAASENDFATDELFDDVLNFIKDCDEVSISLLQRRFRIGYNRSARIMDVLESQGYVLTLDNGKMRKVMKDRSN